MRATKGARSPVSREGENQDIFEMGNLKFQNPKKAKKERIDTLFKKACLLSRIFLHNPPKKGRIALMIEYDQKWQVFLSEENQKWPISFNKLQPAEIRYVKDIRTEKEAKQDLEMEKALELTGICGETESHSSLSSDGTTDTDDHGLASTPSINDDSSLVLIESTPTAFKTRSHASPSRPRTTSSSLPAAELSRPMRRTPRKKSSQHRNVI